MDPVTAIVNLITQSLRLAEHLGVRDAVLTALDAELAAHRALVDRALAAKVHDTERPR